MPKIALDAGHGLHTAGKRTPDGIREWSLNDKVRDKVVDILSKYDVEIMHTDGNEGETDEDLVARIRQYKAAGVDAFVSIHHNAWTGKWNDATGVEVFTDTNYNEQDLKLATLIYERMVKYTGLRGRGVQHTNFLVINQDIIPAVLCEGGFMDGTKDYKIITSDEGQAAYARAVAEGLIEFLNLKLKTEAKPTTSFQPFQVRVTIDNLNYRAEPSMNGKVNGQARRGLYTIVEVSGDWGKLKSGAGWIYLANPEYCTKLGPVAEPKKSVDELAKEVIKGLWGKGKDRRERLTKAGYDYDAVQKKVNELL